MVMNQEKQKVEFSNAIAVLCEKHGLNETEFANMIVKYENRLYRFTSAHSAGEWNSAEVEPAAILDMIADAEPDSLTAAQITALTALLD